MDIVSFDNYVTEAGMQIPSDQEDVTVFLSQRKVFVVLR
jgi:hypothetical protein